MGDALLPFSKHPSLRGHATDFFCRRPRRGTRHADAPLSHPFLASRSSLQTPQRSCRAGS